MSSVRGRRRARRTSNRRRSRLNAKNADRHVLYEHAVQCPEADVEFVDRIYRQTYGALPARLREDFCGTAALCCEWVRTRSDNVATGVDLDSKVLTWSERNNLARLDDEQRKRVTLLEKNVLDLTGTGNGSSAAVAGAPPHVIVSLNFSYFCFKERGTLEQYFSGVRQSLDAKGLYVLDIMGGPEAQVVQEEETEHETYSYVWDQDQFNPITHEVLCHIHFRFPDGSRMKRAFTYDWRLWSVAELRDLLLGVGFSAVDVYWEGTDEDDEDDEGNGIFERSLVGDDSPAWIAYVVATP